MNLKLRISVHKKQKKLKRSYNKKNNLRENKLYEMKG